MDDHSTRQLNGFVNMDAAKPQPPLGYQMDRYEENVGLLSDLVDSLFETFRPVLSETDPSDAETAMPSPPANESSATAYMRTQNRRLYTQIQRLQDLMDRSEV